MLKLILDTARNDERIRAVVMNGSRTNSDVPKDRYRDYDVVYVVSELKPFVQDHSWIDSLGERIILQMPEAMDLLPPCNNGSFNYQMLFADGNRIDLVLLPVGKAGELLGRDSLTINLLDKDGILPPAGEPDDSSYHIKPPTEKLYSDCCNEFWWVLQNVAKGICRDELPYAMRMSEYARDMLDQMLCWHIGGMNGFKVSAGKCGKYFKRYLSELQYKMYVDTYSNAEYGKLWKAVFTMCGLFRETAKAVAERSGFVYNEQEDRGMSAYLKGMKGLTRK
jgi:aminoglycoside 6-adenylyltransferase